MPEHDVALSKLPRDGRCRCGRLLWAEMLPSGYIGFTCPRTIAWWRRALAWLYVCAFANKGR